MNGLAFRLVAGLLLALAAAAPAAAQLLPPLPGGSLIVTLTLSFTGTEVRWLGNRYERGGIARIFVDGTFEGEVNTYAASPVLGEVFRASGFSAGSHPLTIEVTGTSDPAAGNSWVIIDAFDVVTP